MRKHLSLLLVVLPFFLLNFPEAAYAQTPTPTPFLFRSESNIWRTVVGNVPGEKSPRDEIVLWAEKIINALELSCGNRYNRMVADITNDGTYYATKRTATRCNQADENGIYYSTFLPIDAYNLTGFSGFRHVDHLRVDRLITAWRELSKKSEQYVFLDYPSNKKLIVSVEPGYVIFFQRKAFEFDPNDHVAIVHKDIHIDSIGNGELWTYDANNFTKLTRYAVSEYNIQGAPNATIVVGFGGGAQSSASSDGGSGPPISPPPAPGGKFSCPLQSSIITCGSYNTLIRGCGHCLPGGGYGPVNPIDTPQCFASYAAGTKSAIDIGIPGGYSTNHGKPLILPSFEGQAIEWTYVGQEGSTNVEKIIKFAGYNTVTAARYYLQFHHSKPSTFSPGTRFTSGQVGANICDVGAASNCDHSHVQILEGSFSLDPSLWLDSARKFNCP